MSKINQNFIFFYRGKIYSPKHYTILFRYRSKEDSLREICFVKTTDENYFNISFKLDGTRSRIECYSKEKFIKQLKKLAKLFPGNVDVMAVELIEA